MKINRYIIAYYIIGSILGLIYLYPLIGLLESPLYIEPLSFIPFLPFLSLSLIVYVIVLSSIFMYLLGLYAKRTDIVLISIALTHILYLTVLQEYVTISLSLKPFGLALQMFIVSIAFLFIHNLAIVGEIGGKPKVSTEGNLILEGINLLLLLVGPILISLLFLFINDYLISQLISFILSMPSPLDRVLYIYFFNPFSQLFTALLILGGVIWTFKNLFEPFLLTLRLTKEGAYRVIIEEYVNLKNRVERKDLKAKLGRLPRIPSQPVISMFVTILGSIILIFILSNFDFDYSIRILWGVIVSLYNFLLQFVNGAAYDMGGIIMAPHDNLMFNVITEFTIRMRDLIRWVENLLRILMWLLWR